MAAATFIRLEEENAPTNARPRFDHLDGCRTLMTLWVCLEHFLQKHKDVTMGGTRFLMNRANIPVDYYVILSGFVTGA